MPENAAWHDPAHPVPVEYSPAVIERIRALAFDGLLSLPRVGLGVGGFLLGFRQAAAIVIDSFLPIACSHSSGPSFDPTAAEIEAALQKPRPAAREIVGYYCSRPRRSIEFSAKDQALFFELCPGANRLFLLIRPSATEHSRAALFYRKSSGDIVGGVEHPLIPIELEPDAHSAPEPEPELEVVAPELVNEVAEQAPPQFFGEPEPQTQTWRPPAFAIAPQPRRSSWRIIGSVAAALAILAGGWYTRDTWAPRPPLELRTAEIDGHFSVEWNRAAVRGINSGLLTITDGPASKSVPLNRTQLEAGALAYTRQTPEVSAVLIAGDTRAAARFVAPPKPVIPPPPDLPTDSPIPPNPTPPK